MDNLKLSIIIPVYNVENFIAECLESVVAYTGESVEIIIVNDGSKDESITIVKKYIEKYSYIKLINKVNGGLSSARNAGFKSAKGKYVFFIDSDDIIKAESITKILENAEKNNSDIVVADYFEMWDEEKIKIRKDKSNMPMELTDKNKILEKLFMIEISFSVWNKLYRRDFLIKNNIEFKEGIWFEDLEFTFRAFYYSNKITKVDTLFYGYRQRSNSIMTTISEKILDKMEVMEGLKIFLIEKNSLEKNIIGYNALYIKMYLSIIYSCLKNTNDYREIEIIINKTKKYENFYNKVIKNIILNRYLRKSEKIAMILIKYKIINYKLLIFFFKNRRNINENKK